MQKLQERAAVMSFVERHGLWSDAQVEAAVKVEASIRERNLEVVRLSFVDQHGILRGKTVMAGDAPRAMREGCTITEAGYRLAANAERHLKPPQEMARLFRGHEDAVERSLEIVERCRFSLSPIPQGNNRPCRVRSCREALPMIHPEPPVFAFIRLMRQTPLPVRR